MASLYCICPSGLIIIRISHSRSSIKDNIDINNYNNKSISSYLCNMESVWKINTIWSLNYYWISEQKKLCFTVLYRALHLNPFHSPDRWKFRYLYWDTRKSQNMFFPDLYYLRYYSGVTLLLPESLVNLIPAIYVL